MSVNIRDRIKECYKIAQAFYCFLSFLGVYSSSLNLERQGIEGGIQMFDYTSTKWKRKRQSILRRDGYLCQNCKKYGRKTEAQTVHHIKHVDEFPELAFDDSNLVSICNACHNKEHKEKGGAHR